jgi:MATE family multidrug resistance protein
MLIGVAFYMLLSGHSSEITTLGFPYLLIISLSLIPSAINNMIRRYLEGLSFGKIGLLLSFFTLVTNVVFNFLLIYGQYGFPTLGLNGVGIAIVLSETLTVVAGMSYLIYILRPSGYLMDFNFYQTSWKYFRKILSIGWPAGLQFGIEGVYLFFITIMVGWISIEAQAAHAILFNVCQLITIFSIGLGLSGSMLVAQQHGKENGCVVKKVVLTGCIMIWVISIVVGLIFLAISPYIIAFYNPVYEVQCLVNLVVKHICIFQLFYGLCYWGNSVLRGLDDRALPFLFSVVTQLLGMVICYISVTKYHWGISGVWLTLIFERMLLSLFLFIRFGCKTKMFI